MAVGSTSEVAAPAGTAVEARAVEPFPSERVAVGSAAASGTEAAEPSGAAAPFEAEPWTVVPFLHLASFL